MINNRIDNEAKINRSLRLVIALAVILLPVILLSIGVYGSFLFTFSVPVLWQVGIRGESLTSLGLRRKSLGPSLLAGLASGIVLGLLGGRILNLLGITGRALTQVETLQFSLGSFSLEFPLQKELLYYLLTRSRTPGGLFLYLTFSILLIGLGEELFWRGFVQEKIAGRLSKNTAIWLTAGLFALIHFYLFLVVPFKEGIFFLGLIALAGASWGYLFNHFGNIWSAAVSHGITAFIIWKYYFFRF